MKAIAQSKYLRLLITLCLCISMILPVLSCGLGGALACAVEKANIGIYPKTLLITTVYLGASAAVYLIFEKIWKACNT